jgi:hypothetical protein
LPEEARGLYRTQKLFLAAMIGLLSLLKYLVHMIPYFSTNVKCSKQIVVEITNKTSARKESSSIGTIDNRMIA